MDGYVSSLHGLTRRSVIQHGATRRNEISRHITGIEKKTKVCLNAKICDEIPHSTARCYTTRRGETQRDATQRDEKTSRRHVTQNAKRPHAM